MLLIMMIMMIIDESGVRNICTNHWGRKCYSYIYPRVTTTVEDTVEDRGKAEDDNNPDNDAERTDLLL